MEAYAKDSIVMLLAAVLLAQATINLQGDVRVPAPETAAPPPPTTEAYVEDPYRLCICPATPPDDVVTFLGSPKDAELSLAPDGLSVLPRQATIFSVLDDQKAALGEEVKVWHVTKPADCGLTFEYGKRYQVNATRVDGALETSWCLDPRRPKPATP